MIQFNLWFEKQFGKRKQNFKSCNDLMLYNQMRDLKTKLKNVEAELQHRERWDEMLKAAAYAKSAAHNNFKF